MPQSAKSLSKPLDTRKLLVLAILLLGTTWAYAQAPAAISGTVSSHDGAGLSMASITVEGGKGEVADVNGRYRITNVPAGTYKVSAVVVGYKKQTKEVTLRAGQSVTLNFSLEENVQGLEEITVTGQKTDVQQVREQSFSVSSIDVTPLQNLNLDVNSVLNRSTGIRIRQGGGLGSDFNFSLNGFSGNQVRFFVDGISADYLGAGMRFNNIPVNIIDRIEVYKGVVPVHLGADALGGAVNIVTNDNAKDFLDASYSHGSFNTHQAAIASRATFKNKFVLNLSGFFNYSDNDFTVDAPLVDKSTGRIGPDQPFKLFNEQYKGGSVLVEGGVINTKWADRLLVGLIASESNKHLQRGRAMVLNPAGRVYTTDETITPTLKYRKTNLGVKNLSLNLSAIYTATESMRADTSSRIYDWDGTYVTRAFGTTSGEISWFKTNFRFNDRFIFNTATLQYVLKDHHTFTLNNTNSYMRRQGSDPIAEQYTENIAFAQPNTMRKNITGVSYELGLLDNQLKTMVFAKLFNMNTQTQQEVGDTGEYRYIIDKTVQHGFGIASSWFVSKQVQLKASYEHTARLPEDDEMFGDGLLLQPNLTLKPERSHNFNVDVLYTKHLRSDHSLRVDGGLIYRLPKNMIRIVAIGVTAQAQNQTTARVMGAEGTIRYGYKRRVNVELNATYQDIRNNNKTIDSYPDPLRLDRIPNIPYLFGNAMVGVTSNRMGESEWQVGFNWATMYVREFYLNWPSQGSKDSKSVIPNQISHDASVTASAHGGKYNLSFSCWNVADSKLYDNYKVQKPGRSFNVKLRYYIARFKD